jgi:TsgA-like MFS transporter
MFVKRLTLISFLSYFVLSGMLAPIGVLLSPMALMFDIPIPDMARVFGWLTIGNFVGAVLALVIFEYFSFRRLMMGLYLIIMTAVTLLSFQDNLMVLRGLLGIIGGCCGIGLAGGALLISRLYEADRRASMLVITDGSFSIAGFIMAGLAGWTLAMGIHWSISFLLIALVAFAIFIIALTAEFPALEQKSTEAGLGNWSLTVWMAAGGLYFYTLGQTSLLIWLPVYGVNELGVSQSASGAIVGQYWLGMFAAQVLIAWVVSFVGVRKIIAVAVVTTLAFALPFLVITDGSWYPLLALFWGFANMGLFKCLLSFATEQMSPVTPRLISVLLLAATLGTASSPWVSSWVVDLLSSKAALYFACICLLTVLLVAISAMGLERRFARLQKGQ